MKKMTMRGFLLKLSNGHRGIHYTILFTFENIFDVFHNKKILIVSLECSPLRHYHLILLLYGETNKQKIQVVCGNCQFCFKDQTSYINQYIIKVSISLSVLPDTLIQVLVYVNLRQTGSCSPEPTTSY